MSNPYTYDASRRIWYRPEGISIAYSDGDAVERHLLNTLKNALDVSSSSLELAAEIRDWPSEYHFSPARHNLLRPFPFRSTDRILELGCGCGAMTRFLGETGATIIAVEGSARRAEIAAERCRDLNNVSIYCDNLTDFRTDEKFDYVTLIGVLEYAPVFINADDPIDACLRLARAFLKENGTLVLAIENQLGLKYFNGCAEDHKGITHYGINDLYGKSDPTTFGRHVLSHTLSNAGFRHREFFFPFPDYKLPGLILSEAALRDDQLNVADLLIHNTGRGRPDTNHRSFAEDLAWRVAVRNRLLPDLANSFLIFARKKETNHGSVDWLAKMYSRGSRRPSYQVETSIELERDGRLVVRKRKQFAAALDPAHAWLRHVVSNDNYVQGTLFIGKIHEAMAREADIDAISASFAPWLRFLAAHAIQDEGGQRMLPGDYIDCIPANLLETDSGEIHYFDAEWVSPQPIPLAWTVIRGIFNSLTDCLENRHVATMTYRQLIGKVARYGGIPLEECDFLLAAVHEQRLAEQCLLATPSHRTLADVLDERLRGMLRLSAHIPDLRHALAAHEMELARIKSTLSWQITKPLRFVWNTMSRFVNLCFARR